MPHRMNRKFVILSFILALFLALACSPKNQIDTEKTPVTTEVQTVPSDSNKEDDNLNPPKEEKGDEIGEETGDNENVGSEKGVGFMQLPEGVQSALVQDDSSFWLIVN